MQSFYQQDTERWNALAAFVLNIYSPGYSVSALWD